jgi:hypothetical protein
MPSFSGRPADPGPGRRRAPVRFARSALCAARAARRTDRGAGTSVGRATTAARPSQHGTCSSLSTSIWPTWRGCPWRSSTAPSKSSPSGPPGQTPPSATSGAEPQRAAVLRAAQAAVQPLGLAARAPGLCVRLADCARARGRVPAPHNDRCVRRRRCDGRLVRSLHGPMRRVPRP